MNMKKKKWIKEYTVFIIVAVIAAVAILSTSKIGIQKYYFGNDETLQILVLGDSNMAYDFGDRSIPQRIAERLECDVYNCAVGGTTASKTNYKNYADWTIDSLCLYNLTKIIETENAQNLYDFYDDVPLNERYAIDNMYYLTELENEDVDYVVISYGLNDYLAGQPLYSEDPYDETTYAGALRSSIERIQRKYPNATIVVSSITYCVFYEEDGQNFAEGYAKDWGGGSIIAYRDAAKAVAEEYANVYFMDNLELLKIDKTNFAEYMQDSMHLNAVGQEMYVDCFVDVIEEVESGNNG